MYIYLVETNVTRNLIVNYTYTNNRGFYFNTRGRFCSLCLPTITHHGLRPQLENLAKLSHPPGYDLSNPLLSCTMPSSLSILLLAKIILSSQVRVRMVLSPKRASTCAERLTPENNCLNGRKIYWFCYKCIKSVINVI